MIKNIYLLIIFTFANYMFTLVSWYKIKGVFNVADVGNVLIFIGTIYTLFFKKNELNVLVNIFSLFIFLYISSVFIQPVIASFYYNQSLLDGFVAIRHQFYYFSFFFFLLLLKKSETAESFLNCLSITEFFLTLLGIINYFGPVIFFSDWAEGHGLRSGIKRAFIPAMPILSTALIWQFSKFVAKKDGVVQSGFFSLFLFAAHVFRQSRGRLLCLFSLIAILMIYKRKFKLLAGLLLVIILAISIASLVMKENIFTTPFTTATDELKSGKGTWGARKEQITADIKEFQAHPWFGSGLIAYRLSTKIGMSERKHTEFEFKTANQDLGYYHWIKFYGVAGIVWLTFFFILLVKHSRKAEIYACPANKALALFAMSYVGFVIVSFITLSHLTDPDGILLVSFTTAIIVRLNSGDWNPKVCT